MMLAFLIIWVVCGSHLSCIYAVAWSLGCVLSWKQPGWGNKWAASARRLLSPAFWSTRRSDLPVGRYLFVPKHPFHSRNASKAYPHHAEVLSLFLNSNAARCAHWSRESVVIHPADHQVSAQCHEVWSRPLRDVRGRRQGDRRAGGSWTAQFENRRTVGLELPSIAIYLRAVESRYMSNMLCVRAWLCSRTSALQIPFIFLI